MVFFQRKATSIDVKLITQWNDEARVPAHFLVSPFFLIFLFSFFHPSWLLCYRSILHPFEVASSDLVYHYGEPMVNEVTGSADRWKIGNNDTNIWLSSFDSISLLDETNSKSTWSKDSRDQNCSCQKGTRYYCVSILSTFNR